MTVPINFNNLSKADRLKVAKFKSEYYKKYNKPAPVRYLGPSRPQQAKANYSKSSEVKCCDFTTDYSSGNLVNTTNTNACIAVVNTIQPGTGSWNRIGKKIKMKSLRYKLGVYNRVTPTAGSSAQNQIRICVVYDKQPSSGAVPSFDTIFGSTSQTGTEAVLSIFDSLRVDNTERFSVLKDDVFTSNNMPVSTPNISEWQAYVDVFIPLKGLETVFSGQSNPCTIADISTGALYIICRAVDNAAGTGQAAITDSSVRLRYYD